MRSKSYLLSFGLVLSTAVSTYLLAPVITNVATAQQGAAPQAKADNEYQVGAVLYMQKAAEYRALAYQAFNWARIRLDGDEKSKKKLPKKERKMPRAVVVDIDETVLDNSPAQALLIKNREPFSTKGNWYPWGEMRKAKAIPGAVDFLNYAVSRSVKVFFVSNRDEAQKAATMDNLKNVGFQGVTDETVMLRQDPKVSTKTPRREAIAKNYRIVLLMGDNLDDMSDVFELKSTGDRFAEVDKIRQVWGSKYIVLPNAMYGTWENAIYDYQRLSEAQKAEKRASALELP
jgi:5'-nucleotidase (lipoprotein e(P4) family)